MRVARCDAGLAGAAAGPGAVPRFEIDPTWPKPLPEGWITGRLGGVCIDGHDHIIVTNRRDITDEEKETSKQAPSVLIFDRAGSLVDSWGDTTTVPATIHGCAADRENNVWVTGSEDGVLQKYTHAGKLLMEIGKRGVVDTSDGTGKGTALNASHTRLFYPSGLDIDPGNGDLYVADGYGNRRVVVFDREGRFLRQWGRQAIEGRNPGGARRRVRAGGALHRAQQCRAGVRVRSAGRPGPGVRQDGHVPAEHLDQDGDAHAARPARHGLVGRVLARS